MNRKEIAASAPQSEYQKWTKLRRIWALKTSTRWHSGYSWACSPWLIYLFLLDDHQARTCVPLRKTNRFFILSFLPITIMMMQKGAVKYSSYCGGRVGWISSRRQEQPKKAPSLLWLTCPFSITVRIIPLTQQKWPFLCEPTLVFGLNKAS